jgi:multidrug efflux pump subunit AcrA (membrane-fusion protein)
MRFAALLIVAGTFVLTPATLFAGNTVTLPNCLLSLDEEVQVPAQEAGVLMAIPVRDGQQVSNGELLAQIDDTLSQAQRNVAYYKFKAAEREANDDVSVRYATAAAAVANAEYLQAEEANSKVKGAFPQAEVRRLLLKENEMQLTIEKSKKDREVSACQAKVAAAELQAAEAGIARRRVVSPLDGVVLELSRHVGEWVQPGDPIMRLVRVDLLRVEGFVSAKDFNPAELQDRPVDVTVTLARGQKEKFPGKIVFVKSLVQAGNDYLVRAEVKNRKEDGCWLLSPGTSAEMTIQLK